MKSDVSLIIYCSSWLLNNESEIDILCLIFSSIKLVFAIIHQVNVVIISFELNFKIVEVNLLSLLLNLKAEQTVISTLFLYYLIII